MSRFRNSLHVISASFEFRNRQDTSQTIDASVVLVSKFAKGADIGDIANFETTTLVVASTNQEHSWQAVPWTAHSRWKRCALRKRLPLPRAEFIGRGDEHAADHAAVEVDAQGVQLPAHRRNRRDRRRRARRSPDALYRRKGRHRRYCRRYRARSARRHHADREGVAERVGGDGDRGDGHAAQCARHLYGQDRDRRRLSRRHHRSRRRARKKMCRSWRRPKACIRAKSRPASSIVRATKPSSKRVRSAAPPCVSSPTATSPA